MIDIAIVFIYLLVLLFISIYQRSYKSGFKGFARITDRLQKSRFMLVATIFVSSIGGGTTFGITEKAFAGNIAYSYALLLVIPIDILIAIYVVPRIAKYHGCQSIGDIIAKHYGQTGRFIAGFSAILVSLGLVAAQISVSGRIFEYILQVNYVHGVILSYGIIVIYTTIGGFRSVLFASQLQFLAIIIAIPVISIFGLYEIGIENFWQQIPATKISPVNNSNLVNTTISATLGFMAMHLFPTFVQRVLINKDATHTSKAIYIKSLIYAVFLIFITINGLIAYLVYPEAKAGLALPLLIDTIIPTGIQGVVVAGLLAAVMSTADSDLNITSITLVKDFFKPIFKIKNEQKMLLIAKITNVLIGNLAIIIALGFTSVVDLVIFISGFWGPVILVPLLFALFDITIPKKMMVLSSICGGSSFVIWEKYYSDPAALKGVFIGTMVNLSIFLFSYLIIKLMHCKYSKKPLEGEL